VPAAAAYPQHSTITEAAQVHAFLQALLTVSASSAQSWTWNRIQSALLVVLSSLKDSKLLLGQRSLIPRHTTLSSTSHKKPGSEQTRPKDIKPDKLQVLLLRYFRIEALVSPNEHKQQLHLFDSQHCHSFYISPSTLYLE
jgi:hypothetical protein